MHRTQRPSGRRFTVVALLLSLLSGPLHAQTTDTETPLDGTKIFTAGTGTQDPGTYSLSLQYQTSTAHTQFTNGGGRALLNGERQSQLWVLSASAGLEDNLDLTLNTSVNHLRDMFYDLEDEFSLGSGSARGSGLSNLNANLRWRFWEDAEEGRSLALNMGPALNGQVEKVGENYLIHGGFVGWQQSLVFRQDFDPFVGNLELYYSFPIHPNGSTFRQFSTNAALGWNASDWLIPVVEVNYSTVQPESQSTLESLAVTGGLVLKPNHWMSWTLGIQKVIAGRNIENYTTYTLGTSVNF